MMFSVISISVVFPRACYLVTISQSLLPLTTNQSTTRLSVALRHLYRIFALNRRNLVLRALSLDPRKGPRNYVEILGISREAN